MIEGQFPAFEKVIARHRRQGGGARPRAPGHRHPAREPALLRAQPRRPAEPRRRASSSWPPPRPTWARRASRWPPSTQGDDGRDRLQRPIPPRLPGRGGHGRGAARAQGRGEPGHASGPPARARPTTATSSCRCGSRDAGERLVLGRASCEVATCATSARPSLELGAGPERVRGPQRAGQDEPPRRRWPARARPLVPHRGRVRTLIRRGASALRARGVGLAARATRRGLEVELERPGAGCAWTGARCAARRTTAGWRWSSTRPTGCAWCTAHARAPAVPRPRRGRALARLPAGPARVRARGPAAQRRARDRAAPTSRPGTSASWPGRRLRQRRAGYVEPPAGGARGALPSRRGDATRSPSTRPRRRAGDERRAAAPGRRAGRAGARRAPRPAHAWSARTATRSR